MHIIHVHTERPSKQANENFYVRVCVCMDTTANGLKSVLIKNIFAPPFLLMLMLMTMTMEIDNDNARVRLEMMRKCFENGRASKRQQPKSYFNIGSDENRSTANNDNGNNTTAPAASISNGQTKQSHATERGILMVWLFPKAPFACIHYTILLSMRVYHCSRFRCGVDLCARTHTHTNMHVFII